MFLLLSKSHPELFNTVFLFNNKTKYYFFFALYPITYLICNRVIIKNQFLKTFKTKPFIIIIFIVDDSQ